MTKINSKYLGQLSKSELKGVGEYLTDVWNRVDVVGPSNVKGGFPTCLMSFQDRTDDGNSCGYKHISDFYVYSGYYGEVIDESATHILRIVMRSNSTFGEEYTKDLEKIEELEKAVRHGQYLLNKTVMDISTNKCVKNEAPKQEKDK